MLFTGDGGSPTTNFLPLTTVKNPTCTGSRFLVVGDGQTPNWLSKVTQDSGSKANRVMHRDQASTHRQTHILFSGIA